MLSCRTANNEDVGLYFKWANDPLVREQSFQKSVITLPDHTKWYLNKIQESTCLMLVFEVNSVPAGQVRIQRGTNNTAVLGISIDENFRGKGLGPEMIQKASLIYLEKFKDDTIEAYIKTDNIGSIKTFARSGFILKEQLIYEGSQSFLYTKKL